MLTRPRILIVALLVLGLGGGAWGQTAYWVGGVDSNAGNANNWSSTPFPTATSPIGYFPTGLVIGSWPAPANWPVYSLAASGTITTIQLLTAGSQFTVNATGSFTMTGTTVVNAGTITLGSNTTLGIGAGGYSGTGSIAVNGGGITAGATASTVATVTVTGSATLAGGAGGLTISSPVAGNLTTTGAVTLNGTSIGALSNSGTLTLNGNVTTSGTLTNTGGSVAVSGNSLSFAGYTGGSGDAVTVTAGTLTNTGAASTIANLGVTSGVTVIGGLGLTATTTSYASTPAVTTAGIVGLGNGALGALTVTGGSLTLSGGATTASSVTVTAGSLTPGGDLTVGGALAVGGTLAAAGNTVSFDTLSGAGTISTTSGTLTATGNGGTIATVSVTTGATLNGGAGATGLVVSNAVAGNLTTTGKVTLNGTSIGTLSNSGTLTLNGNVTTGGTLTNAGGSVAVGGNSLSFADYTGGSGDEISTTSGTLTATGNGGTIATLSVTTGATLAGGAGATGLVVTNAVAGNLTTTGKVTLNGTSIGTLGNSGTLTLNGDVTTSGTLTNTGGTVAVGGNTLSFAGYTGGSGDAVTVTAGTLTNTGAASTIASLGVTSGVTVIGGLGLTGTTTSYASTPAVTTAGIVGLGNGALGALTVTGGSLTLSGGATTASSVTVTAGSLTPGGDLTVGGALAVGGTLAAAGNTVSFDTLSGAGTISTTSGTLTATGNGGTIATVSVTTGATLNGGAGATGLVVTNAVVGNLTTTGAVTLNGTSIGALSNSGTLTLNGNVTTGGTMTNTGGSVAVGGNSLSFAGYSGGSGDAVTVTAGTLTNTGAASTIASLGVTSGATVNGGLGLTATTTSYASTPAVTTSGTVGLGNGALGALTVTGGSLTLSGGATTATSVTVTAGSLTPGGDLTVGGALAVGGTLAAAGNTVSFDTLSGAGTISTTSGTLTATGNGGTIATVSVTTGATLNGGAGATGLVVTNAVVGNLTTTGKVTLNGTSIGALSNSGTLTLNGNVTTGGTLTNAGGSVAVGGNSLSFADYTGGSGDAISTTSGTLTATGNGGTIATLSVTTGATLAGGAGATGLVVTNAVVGNLITTGKVTLNGAAGTLANSGTLTLNGDVTTGGTLTNAGGSVAVGGNSLSFAGYTGGSGDAVTVTAGTLTNTGAASTIASLGVTSGAAVIGGLGLTATTTSYASTPAVTTAGIVGLGNGALGTLTVTGGSLTLSGGATTASSVTVTAGSLTPGGDLTVGGALAVGGTLAAAGNTVSFDTLSGAGTISTTSGTLTATGNGGTIATVSVTTGAALNGGAGATGLVVTNAVAGNLTTSGKVTLNGAAGTLANSGSLVLNGDLSLSGALSQTAGTLTVPNPRTLALNAGGNTVTGGTLTIASGATVAAGTNSLSLSAGTTLDTSGALTAGNLTIAGGLTNTGANTISASGAVAITGAVTTPANSSLTLTGAGSTLQSVNPLGSLTLASTATGASLSTSALTLAGTLTLNTSSVLSTGALGLTVAGATTIDGTLNGGSGTDSFAGISGGGTLNATTGATTISGGLTGVGFAANGGTVTLTGGSVSAYTFNNVTVGGAVTSTGAWTIGGDLAIGGGATWTAGAFTHRVAGNWTNGGSFTAGGSTVDFTGAGTHLLTGATTFNNLSDTAAGSTLTLTEGESFGVTGTLTLTGASGSQVTVQSSTAAAVTANLGNTGAQAVSFVRVSHVTATTSAISAANSTDLTGDNSNWSFGVVTWLTGGSTNANLATNWSSGVVPGQYDSAAVPSGGNQPTQTAALTVKELTIQAGATWTNGGFNLAVGAGALANIGTFTYSGGTIAGWPATAGGTVVYAAGATAVMSPAGYTDLTVTGGTFSVATASVSGTFLQSGGSVTVPTAVTLTLNGASNSVTGGTLTIASGGTVTSGTNALGFSGAANLGTSGSLTAGDLSFAGTGAWNNTNSSTTASGTVNLASYAGPSGSTLTVSGSGTTLTVPAGGVGNLTVNSAGTITLGADLTVANDLVLTAGTLSHNGSVALRGNLSRTAGVLDLAGGSLTVDGSSGAQSLDLTSASLANLVLDKTIGVATGSISTMPSSWTGNLTLTAGTLSLPNATATIGGNVTGAGTLNAGAVAGANQLTVGGSVGSAGTALGALTAPSGTLNVGGPAFRVTGFTASGGTVDFTGTTGVYAAAAFANLIKSTGGTLTFQPGIALTATGSLTISAGTVVVPDVNSAVGGTVSGAGSLSLAAFTAGRTFSVTGDWNLSGFTAGAGTVVLDSTAAQALTPNGQSFYDLTITAGSAKTVTTAGALTLGRNLEVGASQSLSLGGTLSVAGTTNAVQTSNGTITAAAGAGLSFGGSFEVGTLTSNTGGESFGGAVVLHTYTKSTGTTTFNGTLTPQLFTSNGQTLGNVAVTKGAQAQILRLSGNLTLADGSLTVTTGTLDVNGATLTLNDANAPYTDATLTVGAAGGLNLSTVATGKVSLAGSLSLNAASAFTPGTAAGNSITFTADGGAGTVRTLASGGQSLGNVVVNRPAQTLRLAAAAAQAAGRILTLTAGTLDLNGQTLTPGSSLSLSSATAHTLAVGTGTLALGANSLTQSNAAAVLTVSTGTLGVTGWTQTAGSFTATGAAVLNNAGSMAATGGTWSDTTSTLSLTGAGTTVQFASLTPHHLTVNAGGSVTVTGSALSVGGNLSVTGGTFAGGGQTVTVAGTTGLAGGASLTAGAGTWTFNGAATLAGTVTGTSGAILDFTAAADWTGATYTPNGEIVSFTGGASPTFTTGGVTFGPVTVAKSGGTLTVSGALTAGTFGLSGGTVDVGTAAFDTGAFTQTGGTFVQTGVNGGTQRLASLTLSGGAMTWDASSLGGTLEITGNYNQSVVTPAFNLKNVTIGGTFTGAITLYDLTIAAGKTFTRQPASALTVLHDLTIQNTGTYVSSGLGLTLGGGSVTDGTWTDSNGTLQSLGPVTVNDGGAATTKTLATGLSMTSLTVNASATVAVNSRTLTVGGSVTGTGEISATTGTLSVGQNLAVTTYTRGSTDTVVLSNGTAGAAAVNGGYTFTNLTVNKGAKADTVTPGGNETVAGVLTLTQGTWAAGANTLTTAGDWNSSSANFAFTKGTSTVELTKTGAQVTQGTDAFQNLTFDAGGALLTDLTVAGNLVVTGGTLTDGAGARKFTVSGTSSVTAGANSLSWTNAGNSFAGAVAVSNSGANNVALTAGGALNLGAFSLGTGTVTLVAGGAVTQSGAFVQSAAAGAVGLTAGANPVSLTNGGNDFTGALSVTNTGANAVALTDANALPLGTVSVGTSTLSVTAGGAVTQSGALTRAGGGAAFTIAAGGAVTLTNASNALVTLGTVSRGGAFQLVDSGSLTVNGPVTAGTVTNALSITAAGALTVAGNLATSGANNLSLAGVGVALTGTAAVDAGAGQLLIDAGAAAYSAAATTSLTTTDGSASAVILRHGTTAALGPITASAGSVNLGVVGLTFTGNVTQAAPVTAGTLAAVLGGTATLTLTQAANAFTNLGVITTNGLVRLTSTGAPTVTGAVSTGSHDLTVTTVGLTIGAGSLNAGTATVNLTNSASGTTTQTGTITAAGLQLNGAGTFTLGAANPVGTLAANLTGGGGLTFQSSAAGLTVGSVTTDGLTTSGLSTANQAVALTVPAGAVTVSQPVGTGSGTILLTSLGATQTAALTTTGGLAVSGGGNFVLELAANSLANVAGSVTGGFRAGIASTGAVAVTTVAGVAGWTVASGGVLSLTGTAGWTQDQPIQAPGLQLLGTGPATFTDASNRVPIVAGNLSAGDLSWTDSGAVAVGTVVGTTTSTGLTVPNATFLVGGALTQTQDLSVTTNLAVTAGTNAVTLSRGTNQLNTVSVVSAGALTLNDANGYTVTGAAATGAATLNTAAGNVALTGLVSVTGSDLTLQPAGSIVLNGAAAPLVLSSGAGRMLFNRPVVLAQAATLTGTSGNLTFAAAATVDGTAGGETLTVNAGTATTTFGGKIGFTKTLGALLVTSAGATGVTLGDTVSLAAGAPVTITNGGTVLVSGAVSAPGGFTTTGTGPVTVNGSLTVAGAAGVDLQATAGTIALNAPISTVSGAVLIEASGTTTVAAAGSITASGASTVDFGTTQTGGLSTAGSVTTVGGAIRWHRDATLTGPVSLTSGGGAVAVSGLVSGGGKNLTVNAGAAGAVTFAAAVDNVALFTLTNAASLTASSTWGAGTAGAVTLTNAAGPVRFLGTQTNITTLTTNGGGYTLQIDSSASGSTVAASTLTHTGPLVLGAADSARLLFTTGVDATAEASVTVRGLVQTSNAALKFGSTTLAGVTTLDTQATTAAGALTLGAVTGATNNLTLQTGTGATATVASITGVGTLTLQTIGGTARLAGAVSLAQLTSAASVTLLDLGHDLTATGAVAQTVAGPVQFSKAASPQTLSLAGTTTFSAAADATATTALVHLTAPTLVWTGVAANLKVGTGGVTLEGNVTFASSATLTGSTVGDPTILFTNTTGNTVTFAAVAINGDPIEFQGTADTAWVPNGQTLAAVKVNKGTNGLNLSDAQLTSNAVTILSPVTMQSPGAAVLATAARWTVAAGGFAVTGAQVVWKDARLVVQAGNLTVSGSGGSLDLSTTVANPNSPRGLFLTGTGQTITDTAPAAIQLLGTTATAPVNLVGGTGTIWSSGDPTWTAGDWQLGSVTHQGSISQPASTTLYFFDTGVVLNNLTALGTVDFRAFGLLVPHDATFTGNLNLAAATITGVTTGIGAGNTVTLAGTGTLTAAPAPIPTKTLHSLRHTGAGTLSLATDLGLSGDLTIAAGTFDAPGRRVVVEGNVSVAGAVTAATNLQLYWTPDGNRSFGSAGSLAMVDLFVGGTTTAARTLTQTSAVTVHRLTLVAGHWVTGAFGLTTTEDLVLYGPGYATSHDPERATSRGASNGLLGYPYWSGQAAYFSFLTATGFTDAPGALLTDNPFAATLTVNTGVTVTVGNNFYDHGASLSGAGAWNLVLPAKFTSLMPGDPAHPSDWFGVPFAVAVSTSATQTTSIQNSVASQPVAAAWLLAPNPVLTNAGGNTGWDFSAPTIATARTRFDDLVEIQFSEAVLNLRSELSLAVGQASAIDNLRFGAAGTENASALYQFEGGTGVDLAAGTAGEYAATALPAADVDTRLWVAFQTTTATWNTDAYGSSAGATPAGQATSTNRSRVHQTFVPDLTVEKGRIFDASGNPLKNYGENSAARYTATLDKARPVLIRVLTGQAPKHFAPTTPQDGHNYWHLQWSEPVNLAGHASLGTNASVGTDPSAAAQTAANPTATLAFGDSYTDDAGLAGQVQVTGLFRYAGKLYRSTRLAPDASPQANQVVAGKVSNSLSRSTLSDLYVYLAGASTGTGTSQYWDGFWWGGTNAEVEPAGKTFTVPPAYTASVADLAGNAIETTNVVWLAGAADPKATYAIAATTAATIEGTWEIDRPIFAPYHTSGVTPDSYELVPRDTDSNDKIDRVEFHVLANELLSHQGWRDGSGFISDTGHTAANRTNVNYYGVRDSSLRRFHLGLSLSLDNTTFGIPATVNTAMDDVAPYLDNTGVDNNLFNGGPPPLLGFAVSDDGYFSLLLNQASVPANWKPSSAYYAKYDAFLGMATNLAGRLVEPETNDGTSFKTVDRTPPTISLSLTGKGLKKIYVQFSREVAANDPLGDSTYKNVLQLVTSSGAVATSNSIVSVSFSDFTKTASGFQQMVLTLATPLTADDVLGLRIQAGGAGSIGQAPNYLDNTASFPLTNVGLDLVLPVWASDGSGAEANTAGTDHVVHDFSGKESLTARDIEVQAKVFGGSTATALPLRMFYDFNVASSLKANDLWLPGGFFTPVTPKLIPLSGNSAARYLDPFKINTNKDLRNFIVPGTDSEMVNGNTLEFLFQLGSLYVVRALDPQDPTQMAPWKVPLKGIKTQKNGVTILHNVIDPTQGQKTQVLYTMARSGVVTVQVFALDGSLVKVLHRGRQASGDYSLFWDGKNEAGDVVARGVYFVRVVAPDVDETRNVMVIK